MTKNQSTFTIKGKLDIADITKGIEQIRSNIQASDLGTGLTAGLMKDLNAIQKKFETAFKNLPGVGATSKQVGTFANKIYDAAEDLNLLAQKMKDFGATDKYIKENIGSIQKFANSLADATKKAQEAKEAVKGFKFQETDPDAQVKTLHKESTSRMRRAANTGDTATLEKEYNELTTQINKRIEDSRTKGDTTREQALVKVLQQLKTEWQELVPLAEQVKTSFNAQTKAQEDYERAFQKATDTVNSGAKNIGEDLDKMTEDTKDLGDAAEETAGDLKKMEDANSALDSVQRRLKDLFSTATIFSTIRRIVRGAIQDFQELDKQFNEIAIVSNYSTKEMWESFSDVNKVAQEFGVQTKNVLEVQNLYYHQGKDMAEVNKLTAQTLTLAKITGMDYEKATSDLTAALNAYNIAAEDAVRVTDTIAAMDTNAAISSQELMTALTKTASIAANAGMSLESTEVFLTKMIETTREAPENLGTALKTIIARFGEVKQEIDGQEVELADINRVDTALKSIGISLLDTAGQIRDLDDVFMELSSKWDDLDRNTQRYIATIAAGSRQQSRFIAMMEDYDRTLELTEIAQNSAGLGAKQLAKSQESIESSLNRLKSSWQEFYAGFITSGMIKGVLDLANSFLGLLNHLNKISPVLSAVVIGLTAWVIKNKIVGGLISDFSEKLVTNIASLTTNKGATDANAQSQGFLAKAMTALGFSTNEATEEINKDTASKIANAAATKKATAELIKYNLQQKGWSKDGRLTDSGKYALQRKKEEQKERNKNKTSNKQSFYEGLFPSSNNYLSKMIKDKNFSKESFGELFRASQDEGTVFQKDTIKKLKTVKETIKQGGIKELASKGLTKTLSSLGSKLAPLVRGLGLVKGALAGLGGPIAAITAAVLGATIAWKAFNQSLDDTKEVQKLANAQDNYNKQLTEYNELKENISLIKENDLKKNLTAEEEEKNQEAIKAIVKEYPKYLDYIDEEGKYHLKNIEILDDEIDKKQELLDLEASNLTRQRITGAYKGIYTDETTQAGKAMANLKDFASSLSEDQMKAIANSVDKGLSGFNKDKWYKAIEAYASGEKTSFDNKDWSTLFAGDIGEKNWDELLSIIADGSIDVFDDAGNLIEKNLAEALKETGAYAPMVAENVAQAFAKLNEATGGLYADLLQGAAEEFNNIVIQSAQVYLNKADLNVSSETQKAIEEVIAEEVGELSFGEKINEWFANTEFGRAMGVISPLQEKTKAASDPYINAFKGLSEEQQKAYDQIFTSRNFGNILNSQIENFSKNFEDQDITLLARDKKEELLKTFIKSMDDEIIKNLGVNEETVTNMTDEILNAYAKIIVDELDSYNYDRQQEKFSAIRERLSPEYQSQFNTHMGSLTADQAKAYASSISSMNIDEQIQYTIGMLDALNSASEDSKNKLQDIFSGANVSTPEGIIDLQMQLLELGYTAEEAYQILSKLGLVDEIKIQSIEDLKMLEEQIQKYTNSLEAVSALTEGVANDTQLQSYLDSIITSWMAVNDTTDTAAMIEFVDNLNNSIIVTSEGYKIAEDAALDYTTNSKKAILDLLATHIAVLRSMIEAGNATADQLLSYITLTKQYALLTAKTKKAVAGASKSGSSGANKVNKALEEAKEKADALLESLKQLVQWLMDFDRFASLNRVGDKLEQTFEDLEFEIEFSTNSEVIAQDIQKQIENLNTQIAFNQGGINAAQDEMAMRRDLIEKNFSEYVSFDPYGTAIVNAEKMQELQEEIAKADEFRKPTLQAEADLIMDSVDAYQKAEDAARDYTVALQGNFTQLEKVLMSVYDAEIAMTDKLIEVRMEQEDEEVELVKEKVDKIKEANDAYLDNIQKMVDEERRIRDRAKKYQNVKNKEKKLAMMKMDTSGVYANDIRALEDEINTDYQGLRDESVDNAINKMGAQNDAYAKILDREVQYLELSLQRKRKDMTEYNTWATNLIKSGSDEVMLYLKTNDQEYITATDAEKKKLELEWTKMIERADAAHQILSQNLIDDVVTSLDTCKESADGFKGAVEQYEETALGANGNIKTSVGELTTYYQNLAGGVIGVKEAVDKLKEAYEGAETAARKLKAAQDAVTGGGYTGEEPHELEIDDRPAPSVTDIENSLKDTKNIKTTTVGNYKNVGWGFLGAWDEGLRVTPNSTQIITKNGKTFEVVHVKDFNGYVRTDALRLDEDSSNTSFKEFSKTEEHPESYLWKIKEDQEVYKFAKGGYVDYTGPAWVDGTKSHPEYMLNAAQTQQFETLVAALSNMFSPTNQIVPQKADQKNGDAIFNFHIKVDQLSSDYDVDQLLERMEKRIAKTGKYRNVTMITKSK